MLGTRTLGEDRRVATRQEGVGPCAAEAKCGGDDAHLRVVERRQRFPPSRVVHGPAVVGVDEAVVEHLGALVHVGNAGDGERQQLLAERVAHAVGPQLTDESGQLDSDRTVDDVVEPLVDGGLEFCVRLVPAGVYRGFPYRLFGVVVQPFPQLVGDDSVCGPHAEGVLQQEQCGGLVRPRCGDRPPARQFVPQRGHLRKHPDAGAHVLAPLRIVSRQRDHGLRPQPRPHRGSVVEFGRVDPEAVGFAADLVERHQPRVPVEQAVLHRLRGHRSTQLLEARRGLGVFEGRRDRAKWSRQLRCDAGGLGERGGHQRGQSAIVAAIHVEVGE